MDDSMRLPVEVLQALPGLQIAVGAGPSRDDLTADAMISVSSQTGISRYVAAARSSVTTTSLAGVIATLERYRSAFRLQPLLLAPYLTPAVVRRLRENKIEFVDGAGNIYLDGPAAYVLLLGGKSDWKPTQRGFTATDLRVIYALLARPELRHATTRQLQAATGVSLGKISGTISQLEAAGHVARAPNGTLLIRDHLRLLGRWDVGYLEQLRPSLSPSGWRRRDGISLDDVSAAASDVDDVLVGGEYAADAFTRHLRPATLTLHVPAGTMTAVAVKLKLPPDNSAGDVMLLNRFAHRIDAADLALVSHKRPAPDYRLAHPIVVRSELLAFADDRLNEVADQLLNDVIIPEFAHAVA